MDDIRKELDDPTKRYTYLWNYLTSVRRQSTTRAAMTQAKKDFESGTTKFFKNLKIKPVTYDQV